MFSPDTFSLGYLLIHYYSMQNFSEDFVAVEQLFLAVHISDLNDVVVVDAEAIIDLTEFNLTPEEINKIKDIFRKLNSKLVASFQEQYPASSVISEILSKDQNKSED